MAPNLTLTWNRSRLTQGRHLYTDVSTNSTDSMNQVSRRLAECFWRRRFFKVLTYIWAWQPYWSCDLPKYINCFPLHMKFKWNWPKCFRDKLHWKCWKTTDKWPLPKVTKWSWPLECLRGWIWMLFHIEKHKSNRKYMFPLFPFKSLREQIWLCHI